VVKDNASQRFMRATGKLRAIFGPANRSSLVHDMTEENRRLLAQREAESQQWETLHRPDGSTYVVPKDPDDKSLR
jgi:aspartate/methionine/tyrosine aminotransferase